MNGDNQLDIAYFASSLLYFEAPAKFLGNKISAYNKLLSLEVGDSGSGAS